MQLIALVYHLPLYVCTCLNFFLPYAHGLYKQHEGAIIHLAFWSQVDSTMFNCWMHVWSIGHCLCIDYYRGNNVHLANLKVIVMLLIGSCPFNVGCYVSSATYVEIYVPWMKFGNNQKYDLKLKVVHSSYLYA